LKALISVGFRFPLERVLLSTGPIENKAAFLSSARKLEALGVEFFATRGTAAFMRRNGIETTALSWPLDEDPSGTLAYIRERKVDLVINIPKHDEREELTNDYLIRRAAVDFGVPLITNLQLAQRLADALFRVPIAELEVHGWSQYDRRSTRNAR
jgi:carbamoyl-phosphate synthase large subunit